MRQVIMYPGEDGYWVIECPSLPGCVSQGRTEQEAVENIVQAIKLWIADALDHDEKIPTDVEIKVIPVEFGIDGALYNRLDAYAQTHGQTIRQLVDSWQLPTPGRAEAPETRGDLDQRRQSVQRIDRLRKRLFSTYGEMPDSVELVREDRLR